MMATLLQTLRPLLLLGLSALFEVGGDAGMRVGLQGKRFGFLLGTLSFFLYGLLVNLPRWEFGKLMGVYIAVFFVVSQGIAVLGFREKLTLPTLVGGALIVAGGLVLTVWNGSK
jgi:small multidrug resistance family-3 protein